MNGSLFDRMAIIVSNDDIIVRKSCFKPRLIWQYVPYDICLKYNAMQIGSVQVQTDTFISKYKWKILMETQFTIISNQQTFIHIKKEQFLDKNTTTAGQDCCQYMCVYVPIYLKSYSTSSKNYSSLLWKAMKEKRREEAAGIFKQWLLLNVFSLSTAIATLARGDDKRLHLIGPLDCYTKSRWIPPKRENILQPLGQVSNIL